MGIVVSGEDRKTNSLDEQQIINQIAAENDFGLVITTLDQLFVFFGTWWSFSLTGRVNTFHRYTHAALLDVIRAERQTTGVLGFYFAGIPTWAISSGLAIARENPLKRIFATARDYVLDLTGNDKLSLGVRSFFILNYSVVRTSLLLLSVETYLYSLLQSLALVSSSSMPAITSLFPFGRKSLLFLPSPPREISGSSLCQFALQLLTSPGVLACIHAFYLRPNLEERIYRLIRRQLPKPKLADELSVRVAYDENLIDWIVPTLGRHSEEETHREKLTLLEDIKYEMSVFRSWIVSFFSFVSRTNSVNRDPGTPNQERIQRLRHSIESLQHQLEEVQVRNNLVSATSGASLERLPEEVEENNTNNANRSSLRPIAEHEDMPDLHSGINQVFTNENRISQSPGEMSNDYFSSDIGPLGQITATSPTSAARTPGRNLQSDDNGASSTRTQLDSRTNTLFSRPSSPGTSPPTSPRVRASLIHQGSDIITMQLELLGARTRGRQNAASTRYSHALGAGHGATGLNPLSTASDLRPIADFLESLIMNQAQSQASQVPPTGERPNPTSSEPMRNNPALHEMSGTEVLARHSAQPMSATDQPAEATDDDAAVSLASTLPLERLEGHRGSALHGQYPTLTGNGQGRVENGVSGDAPPLQGSRGMEQVSLSNQIGAHRVTLLSAHPVDSLASHLAAFIATIILSPIESLCLRSLATSYVALYPLATGRDSVLPVGLWFGGTSWPEISAYSGKVILMRGMQAAIRAGIWGFLVGSTMRIGRKFCGWGEL
ncbi:hypothetical protein POX_f07807 [Penicillium oxalicum]|uniref:hypothetical protein n=1 Tax=Penicillium oxalicum TaxID=69781 RepID=UPI0020B67EBF|nr:hypothetical protein POX_f07807 [Penicillium oxalicum]KAI2787443.1 hypothetical protein POX_f07807 [Penicillium oxalicum]